MNIARSNRSWRVCLCLLLGALGCSCSSSNSNDINGAGGTAGSGGSGGDAGSGGVGGTSGNGGSGGNTSDAGNDASADAPVGDSNPDVVVEGGAGEDAETGPKVCQPATDATKMAMVFDIDATLTTADSEYTKQMADPAYDPAMRPDADKLAQGYAALGYKVFYVTARGTSLGLLDGTSATKATTDWLDKHSFPRLDGTVFLAPGLGASGTAATTYKTGVLQDLQGKGYLLNFAYGNATTDIDAYLNVTLQKDHIFLVGSASNQASTYGVVPITDAQAYTSHLASYLPSVPCAN